MKALITGGAGFIGSHLAERLLADGDEVLVGASTHTARFARVQEQTYFYKTLVGRLSPRDHTAGL